MDTLLRLSHCLGLLLCDGFASRRRCEPASILACQGTRVVALGSRKTTRNPYNFAGQGRWHAVMTRGKTVISLQHNRASATHAGMSGTGADVALARCSLAPCPGRQVGTQGHAVVHVGQATDAVFLGARASRPLRKQARRLRSQAQATPKPTTVWPWSILGST